MAKLSMEEAQKHFEQSTRKLHLSKKARMLARQASHWEYSSDGTPRVLLGADRKIGVAFRREDKQIVARIYAAAG